MSTRPEPRRSPLTGLSPITPQTMAASAPAPHTDAPARATTRSTSFDKLTIRVDSDLAGRARSAFWSTAHTTGCRSLSEWISEAIADKIHTDEAEYNAGQPYQPMPAGTIPTGRRS